MKFEIGNLVTCKIGSLTFNADIIGINNGTISGPKYIIRDYTPRTKTLGEKEINTYNVPGKFKNQKDWRYFPDKYIHQYDGTSRAAPSAFINDIDNGLDPQTIYKSRYSCVICAAQILNDRYLSIDV